MNASLNRIYTVYNINGTCNMRLTGPSVAVYGNSPVPHSKSARPRLQISVGYE